MQHLKLIGYAIYSKFDLKYKTFEGEEVVSKGRFLLHTPKIYQTRKIAEEAIDNFSKVEKIEYQIREIYTND